MLPIQVKRTKKGVGTSLLSLTRGSQGHCSLLLFTSDLIKFSSAVYMAPGETAHKQPDLLYFTAECSI